MAATQFISNSQEVGESIVTRRWEGDVEQSRENGSTHGAVIAEERLVGLSRHKRECACVKAAGTAISSYYTEINPVRYTRTYMSEAIICLRQRRILIDFVTGA